MNISKDILRNLSISVDKPEKVLKEEVDSSDNIQVYMNTWKNYNEYGADLEAYGIKDGWMTPEQGLEFCKKYAEDEPFINDVNNCPFEVSEYDSASQVLENMIKFNNFEDKQLLKNAMETNYYNNNDVDSYIEKLESGDYIWFPEVKDDFDLGKAYIDMIGGISEAVSKDRLDEFIDRKKVIEYIESTYSEEDLEEYGGAEEEADAMIDSYVEAGRDDFIDNYFDYDHFGRELSMDGYTFTSDGCIQII